MIYFTSSWREVTLMLRVWFSFCWWSLWEKKHQKKRKTGLVLACKVQQSKTRPLHIQFVCGVESLCFREHTKRGELRLVQLMSLHWILTLEFLQLEQPHQSHRKVWGAVQGKQEGRAPTSCLFCQRICSLFSSDRFRLFLASSSSSSKDLAFNTEFWTLHRGKQIQRNFSQLMLVVYIGWK